MKSITIMSIIVSDPSCLVCGSSLLVSFTYFSEQSFVSYSNSQDLKAKNHCLMQSAIR